MPDVALSFTDKEKIGAVVGVDTSRVFIEVSNHTLVTRMPVGGLLAIQGSTADEYLIGMTDRITRSLEAQASVVRRK